MKMVYVFLRESFDRQVGPAYLAPSANARRRTWGGNVINPCRITDRD